MSAAESVPDKRADFHHQLEKELGKIGKRTWPLANDSRKPVTRAADRQTQHPPPRTILALERTRAVPSTGSPCSCLTMLCSAASQVALAVKNLPANVRDAKRLRFDPWLGKIPWGRKWQPTPVFLPGKFHRQRSLAGYSPWGHRESDTTEQLSRPQEMSCIYPTV